jgi:hypothetical protein
MSRLHSVAESEIEVNVLYNTYKLEQIEAENRSPQPIVGMRVLIEVLTEIFPHVKRVRKRGHSGKWLTLYRGVSLKPMAPIKSTEYSLEDIVKQIPHIYTIYKATDKSVSCHIESNCIANGNKVIKTVSFHDNGTWELNVFGRIVDLSKIDIDNTFEYCESSINGVCSLVQNLHICEGIIHKQSILMNRFHTMDKFQVSESKPAVRTIRSVTCNGVVGFASQSKTCRTCRTMTFSTTDKENKSPCSGQSNNINDNKITRIKHLLKLANPELVSLFLEQSDNSRDPKGRWWSKSFIGTCLQIYNRSPHSYELLLSSKILILPSASTLVLYKSKLKQDPGFDHTMFEWMLKEAKKRNPCRRNDRRTHI